VSDIHDAVSEDARQAEATTRLVAELQESQEDVRRVEETNARHAREAEKESEKFTERLKSGMNRWMSA
jgi:dsDNA-specific endonuclease/ATPase MutS2